MNRIQVAAPAPRRFQGVAGRSGVVEQIHEDDKVRAELAERREAVRDKMRRIRDVCRGMFGRAGVNRVGLKTNLFGSGYAGLG